MPYFLSTAPRKVVIIIEVISTSRGDVNAGSIQSFGHLFPGSGTKGANKNGRGVVKWNHSGTMSVEK